MRVLNRVEWKTWSDDFPLLVDLPEHDSPLSR